MLDASLSFDGVNEALLLTEDLFGIVIGFGSGAMYMRLMIIMRAGKRALTQV